MIRKGKMFRKVSLKKKRKLSGFRPQLYSPREKMQNCIWIFKLGDADDHPAIPHAHAQEVGYRLNAWTGDIYPAGNEREKTIGKLNAKELQRLHKDEGFLKFARKQIQWYRAEYPHISFFVPEWFELKYMQMCRLVIEEVDAIEEYVFIGKANIHS